MYYDILLCNVQKASLIQTEILHYTIAYYRRCHASMCVCVHVYVHVHLKTYKSVNIYI